MYREILCIGEVLWDALPAGLFLGGAPFNVGCHLQALGRPVALVSAVGNDVLGEEALRRLVHRGLATDLVRVEPALPTGFVRAQLDDAGDARYDIVSPAAWEAIPCDHTMLERAARAEAVVFGSLAQRAETSRSTIRRACEAAALRVFDVNLRPPHDNADVVAASLALADWVKLNHEELARLSAWFAPEAEGEAAAACALAERFALDVVCVTRGGSGAALLRRGRWIEQPGVPVRVEDTVGSGDAFRAALLVGLLNGAPEAEALEGANRLGAFVASQRGAVPPYNPAAFGGGRTP